jgi:hypothetical protein
MTARNTVSAIVAALAQGEENVQRVAGEPPQGWRPPAPEPADVRRELRLAAVTEADSNRLVSAGRARLNDRSEPEVLTRHGWVQAADWAVRQALDGAPSETAGEPATDAEIGQAAPYRRRSR